MPASPIPSPRKSLKRPRPGRLQLELLTSLSCSVGHTSTFNNTHSTPPLPALSPISPNCPAASRKLKNLGGFSCFAANYPQYCESKCPVLSGNCCQQMVEPSYAVSNGPTQLLSFLFVGSQTDATDADVISRLGITHVLNVSANCIQSQHVPSGNFMRVPVNDGYADKLLPHFKQAFQFLENVRQSNGRCLVHCLAGISRSPTLTIAYIMQHLRLSHDEAYRYVKARRPSISPNFNFLGQLMEFERQLQCQQTQQQATDAADPEAIRLAEVEAVASCPEAKRQRRVLPASPASPSLLGQSASASPLCATPGQSPTSALSRLTFVQQQQQMQLKAAAAAALAGVVSSDDTTRSVSCDPAVAAAARQRHIHHQKRRQRPRSVVLAASGPMDAVVSLSAATAAVVPSTAAASVSASASLGGSQEITCS